MNMTEQEKELINLRVELQETKQRFRSFVNQASDMMNVQQEFFKTRDKEVLNLSKSLERKMEKTILEFRATEAQVPLPF